jgi:hypothetical protein
MYKRVKKKIIKKKQNFLNIIDQRRDEKRREETNIHRKEDKRKLWIKFISNW